MTRPEARAEEREIFKVFAAAAGLGLVAGSIEQPDPPDIVCTTRDYPRVAFELTRLDDAHELRVKGDWLRTPDLWHEVLSELDEADRRQLHSLHGKLEIAVTIDETADQRVRRQAFRALAHRLITIPALDKRPLPRDSRSAEACIRVVQARTFPSVNNGPLVREVHAGWLRPVDFRRIDAKLVPGEYTVDFRLELLAYARWNDPLSAHHHDARGYLADRIPGSRFARAWIYEVMTNRVIASFP